VIFWFPSRSILSMICVIFLCLQFSTLLADQPTEQTGSQVAKKIDSASKDAGPVWKPMTGKWTECHFGGDGPIEIGKRVTKIGMGDPMSGVRWEGKFPKDSYELRLEARRTDGFDFFCGVTFPIGSKSCSLVLGGWGGGVLGISSIDGEDASSNETTQFMTFKNDQWYKIRIEVLPKTLKCWVEDKLMVDVERADHQFDIRIEMDPALPLGIANYQCDSEIRNVEMRDLTPAKKKPDSAK